MRILQHTSPMTKNIGCKSKHFNAKFDQSSVRSLLVFKKFRPQWNFTLGVEYDLLVWNLISESGRGHFCESVYLMVLNFGIFSEIFLVITIDMSQFPPKVLHFICFWNWMGGIGYWNACPYKWTIETIPPHTNILKARSKLRKKS